jgi:hypothetical protein
MQNASKEKFDYTQLSYEFASRAENADQDRKYLGVRPRHTIRDTDYDNSLARYYLYNALHGRDVKTKAELIALIDVVLNNPVPHDARDSERYIRLRQICANQVLAQIAELAD